MLVELNRIVPALEKLSFKVAYRSILKTDGIDLFFTMLNTPGMNMSSSVVGMMIRNADLKLEPALNVCDHGLPKLYTVVVIISPPDADD